VGATKAKTGYYELTYEENPWDNEDAYVHVFPSYEQAQDWIKGRVHIINYQQHHDGDIDRLGEYLTTREPDEDLHSFIFS
jgi:hypothetical protein